MIKNLKTSQGKIESPRDRNTSFETVLIPKKDVSTIEEKYQLCMKEVHLRLRIYTFFNII